MTDTATAGAGALPCDRRDRRDRQGTAATGGVAGKPGTGARHRPLLVPRHGAVAEIARSRTITATASSSTSALPRDWRHHHLVAAMQGVDLDD